MTRYGSLAALAVLALVGGRASADTGTLPGGSTLSFYKLFIHEDGGDYKEPSDDTARRHYFNLAHCTCSKAGAGKEQTFEYLFKLDMTTNSHRPFDLWVGTGCETQTSRALTCRQVGSISDVDNVVLGNTQPELKIFDVVNPTTDLANQDCQQIEGGGIEWVMMKTTATAGDYDYILTQEVGLNPTSTAAETIGIDTKPPPLPTDFKVTPSENAIDLSWTAPTSNANDIFEYQALCAKADGTAALAKPSSDAVFDSVSTLCNLAGADPELTPTDVTGGDSGSGSGTDVDAPVAIDAAVADASTIDGGVAIDAAPAIDAPAAPAGFPAKLLALDPSFVCGTQTASTATSMTISGLENYQPYYVVLLAVDLHGNYTGTYFTSTITPKPVVDFWEDLHDRGSDVEGGFCLIASTYGDDSGLTNLLRSFRDDTLGGSRVGRWLTDVYYATLGKLGAYVEGHIVLRVLSGVLLLPLVAIALLWHVLTLPGLLALVAILALLRRRAKLARRALVPATAAAALLASFAGTSRAHADANDWINDPASSSRETDDADLPGVAHWHAAFRMGPFTPDIDSQLGAAGNGSSGKGPYAEMYGGYSLLPMIDVDRFFFTRIGQLGVGISVGYLRKTAKAWATDPDPTNPDPRSHDPYVPGPSRLRSGADTSFLLLPAALTVTYRFSYLDDEYGIPVVPYARAGLAYSAWFMTAPSGSFSKICDDDACDDPNKGRGGSLGYTGTIGIAIRAERVDATAARSMRESGIQHAGFFAELQAAKVDGFGSSKKLSVGDKTWFAGVDFEF